MTIIMDARPLFNKIKEETKSEVVLLKKKGIVPGLAAVLVSDDPISHTYVSLKQKDCEEVGIKSENFDLSKVEAQYRELEVINVVEELNNRKDIHAILVQTPFPNFVSIEKIFEMISPDKDVDGLTAFRLGKLLRGEYNYDSDLLSCTPRGVVELLKYYKVDVSDKVVAIIGRSVLVSNPLRKMLEDMDATATCYHTKSKNMFERIKEADIIISAAGRPPEIFKERSFKLTGDMIKSGVIVVGVGVRKDSNTGKLYFDVDFDSVKEKTSFVTPNIGGVGLMTRAMLLKNTIIACKNLTNNW